MSDLLIDPHSRDTAPWPCDCGARVQTTTNRAGRVIRAKWRRCLGGCLRWFWSEDAINNRMCGHCARGEVRTVTRPLSDRQPPPLQPVPPPPRRKSHGRNAGRRVLAEGQEFPTVRAASRALRMDLNVLGRRLRAEKPGYRYLD